MLRTRTTVAKPADTKRTWYVVDASTAPLGRIATVVARKLSGKDKVDYTPHVDKGDFVIVVNTDDIKVTGKKMEQKTYYRHSGYIGNLKETSLKAQMAKNSTKVFEDAVYGMVPKNKLRAARMERLKVYAGEEHQHAAQKPQELKIGDK